MYGILSLERLLYSVKKSRKVTSNFGLIDENAKRIFVLLNYPAGKVRWINVILRFEFILCNVGFERCFKVR